MKATAGDEKCRHHWRPLVVKQAEQHAQLLGIILDDELFGALPTPMQRPLVEKVEQVVADCARRAKAGELAVDIRREVNAELWRFMRPWSRNPRLP